MVSLSDGVTARGLSTTGLNLQKCAGKQHASSIMRSPAVSPHTRQSRSTLLCVPRPATSQSLGRLTGQMHNALRVCSTPYSHGRLSSERRRVVECNNSGWRGGGGGGGGRGRGPSPLDRRWQTDWADPPVGDGRGGNGEEGWKLPEALTLPRQSAESDALPAPEREAAIRAVESLGGRVTVGDVASKAGLTVTAAERSLKALAADANGFLEVSDQGDVLYVLPRNLRAAVAQRSLRLRLAPVLEKGKQAVGYISRVLFGSALLASILIVYTAIFALMSARSENDNRNDNRGGYSSRYYGGPSFFFNPTDIFWYWDPFYYRRRRFVEKQEMNFFESVFSFVFGDGDPNAELEERRWQKVGRIIADRGGVVTAQEVAPFLDLPSDPSDESFMIPVLQRFEGVPQVDEQGNILYTFPQLQRTATSWLGQRKPLFGSASASASLDPSAPILAEEEWKLSNAPPFKQALAAGLGVINVVGLLYLSSLLSDPMVIRQAGLELVSSISSVMPFLQAYALSFFAIPAVRWLWQQSANEAIGERNQRRQLAAAQLARPSAQLRRKMANAREQAQRVLVSDDKIVYSTARDVDDQAVEADQWERKLQQKKTQGD